MIDYTNGKIKDFGQLVGSFDGACEPRNPGGVCASAWVIHDAETNEKLAAEGKVVRDGRNKKPKDARATNNFAEYCALGLMLRFLIDNQWKGSITIYSDSKLVVNQVNQEWQMKSETLRPLRERIFEHLDKLDLVLGAGFECFTCEKTGPLELMVDLGDQKVCPSCGNTIDHFNTEANCSLIWVPRDQNEEADQLGRQVYTEYTGSKMPERRKK